MSDINLIQKILTCFPESYTEELLEKIPGSGYKKQAGVSACSFVKEKISNDQEFTDKLMKKFQDDAKKNWLELLLEDNPKYIEEQLRSYGVDADGDTSVKEKEIEEILNREDSSKEFVSKIENAAGNGMMHIFFYKIEDNVEHEQLKDLQEKIDQLDDLIPKARDIERIQPEIEKLKIQMRSRRANKKKIQSKIKKLEDMKSQRKILKKLQAQINKIKKLKPIIEDIKKLKPEIEKLENLIQSKNVEIKNLQSKTKRLEYLKSKRDTLEKKKAKIVEIDGLVFKTINLKMLQEKIEELEDRKSEIKDFKKLQANIDKLKYLEAQRKTLIDIQENIDERGHLETQIKYLEKKKAEIEGLRNQELREKRLKNLQKQIAKLIDRESELKDLSDLQIIIAELKKRKSKLKDLNDLHANIDKLLQAQKDIFLWGAAQPVLVSVEKPQNDRNEVWFKWVKSRFWNELKTDRPTPYYVRRMERSVNYFIIDLENNKAQLRIQLIRHNPLEPLKSEYNRFRTEIDKLLGFFHFSRIPMEAVVKKFLSRGKITPLTWEMQLPHGAYVSAKGRPETFFDILGKLDVFKYLGMSLGKGVSMAVINRKIFFGRKLSCECQLAGDDPESPAIRIKIDGEKDVLTILTECEPEHFKTIIKVVLSVKKNKLIDKTMKNFLHNGNFPNNLTIAERFLFERIVLSFDYHFDRLEENEIRARHLKDSEWFPKIVIVNNAMDRLCQEYPGEYICKGTRSNRILEKIIPVKRKQKSIPTGVTKENS